MRIALKFAYNGQNFYGYARQPGLKTVEGEVIKTLIKHDFIEDTKESCFRSASRTDKYVSALCNVVSFNSSFTKKQILKSMTAEVGDIIFYGVSLVESDFNPRHAKSRTYRYYLHKENLDIDKVAKTLALFTGTHDFTNFAKVEGLKNPVRTIENIVLTETDDFFIVDFYAPNFLWNQIRRIISAVQKAGIGKIDEREVAEALDNPEKIVDFNVASAKPLILKDIVYDFSFEYAKKIHNRLEQIENEVVSNL